MFRPMKTVSPEEKEYVDWWAREIDKAEAEKGPMGEWGRHNTTVFRRRGCWSPGGAAGHRAGEA